ncbi:hypothetical protein ILUMI_21501 [Ignelater luminosus]|uniref:Uncharacterized protein n=1 Tax=Ignelater luminosus TaxID=2038154 RepID=A0A8K0CGA4_IGNLU|nr:hypothetical protein ILUMI_21501 [Ignelater luminosus]
MCRVVQLNEAGQNSLAVVHTAWLIPLKRNEKESEVTSDLADTDIEISVSKQKRKISRTICDSDSDDEENRYPRPPKIFAVKLNSLRKLPALSDLLQILQRHPYGTKLPTDPRILLKSPQSTIIRAVKSSHYLYIGVRNGILQVLKNKQIKLKSGCIFLKISVDRLPISNNSTSQLWPILDSNDFLSEFASEVKILINERIEYCEKTISVAIHSLIYDAPAKSFVLKTKGHGGYSSCSRCFIGEYADSRLCFPTINCQKRTDKDLYKQIDEAHHTGISVLTSIPNFGVVSNVPIDYMHLVCIGVVGKIITLCINGSLKYRLPHKQTTKIPSKLLSLRRYIIKEFARKPQELAAVHQWKATENVPLIFVTSSTTPDIYLQQHSEYAESLLEHFVSTFTSIYGKSLVSHNIHGLIHLVDDAKSLGTLDAYSAFPFENFMRCLKLQLRKNNKPLQQLHRRYMEFCSKEIYSSESSINNFTSNYTFNNKHEVGPVIKAVEVQFKELQVFEWFYNFVKIRQEMMIIGKRFENVSDVYTKPCRSSSIGVVHVEGLCENLEELILLKMNLEWSVVLFDDGLQLVPSDWINNLSYWPIFTSNSRYEKAVKSREEPDENWPLYPMRILGTYRNTKKRIISSSGEESDSSAANLLDDFPKVPDELHKKNNRDKDITIRMQTKNNDQCEDRIFGQAENENVNILLTSGRSGHLGYSSCAKYNTKGIYCDKRICFPTLDNLVQRTDYDFRTKRDPYHYFGTSILKLIPNLDRIKDILLDYRKRKNADHTRLLENLREVTVHTACKNRYSNPKVITAYICRGVQEVAQSAVAPRVRSRVRAFNFLDNCLLHMWGRATKMETKWSQITDSQRMELSVKETMMKAAAASED